MKAAIVLFCIFPLSAALGQKVVDPQVDSVSLFKNGLAIVRIRFPVDGPGQYRWNKIPRIAHGSFWIESDGKVSVRATTQMIEEPAQIESPTGNLQRDLAGKTVRVQLKAEAASDNGEFSGLVWQVPESANAPAWDADYSSDDPNSGSYYWHRRQIAAAVGRTSSPQTGRFLILQDAAGGRRYIDQSTITSLTVDGPFEPTARLEERPVLIFDVSEAPADGGAVQISYFTRGLAWLPAYQLDLSDSASLKIRQSAVVRNEMDDLEESEIKLISGYPNVHFGNVDSPLWPGTSLATFFQQVNQPGTASQGILSNRFVTQQMVSIIQGPGDDSAALPDMGELSGASDDIHYQSIGRRSMKAGDTLSLEVAAATAEFERVVEWTVPDPRDGSGRYQSSQRDLTSEPWDAVRFANPFSFPMTTAAATVVENGAFRGQSISEWVNPGQQTCLRITRALSVRGESSEVEEEGEREIVWVGGNDYQRTSVRGQLAVRNFRSTEVTFLIRSEFSGELLEADGKPEKSLRMEGVSSVNPRRQLNWTLKLAAGEERVVDYRYQVLVDR